MEPVGLAAAHPGLYAKLPDVDGRDFASALTSLGEFLDRAPLTESIARLEGALEGSTAMAEFYVLGEKPLQFLRGSRSPAQWGLDRSPPTQRLFEERFGPLDMPIADFVGGPGAHVRVIDLEERLPQLFGART